jgi:hypothetical protein
VYSPSNKVRLAVTQSSDGQYPGDASGFNNPTLQNFVGNMQTEEGRAWAAKSADRIQNYLTTQAIAKQNQAAGDAFVNNMAQTKAGLVNLAKSDPNAIGLALGLAKDSVDGIVGQHQHLDEDTRNGVASDLTSHMQTEIAHAGLQNLAETDRETFNRGMDAYGSFLPDDQKAALSQYADVQHGLRLQDTAAQQRQQIKDTAVAGYNSATTYLSAMVDPTTQGYRAPPGFAAKLISDPSLSAPTRLALHAGYGLLNQNGDPPSSDAGVLSDMVSRIASDDPPQQGEVISHLGTGLRVADASYLNTLLGPTNPQQDANIDGLAKVFKDAQSTLAAPENGPAGKGAFQRFTDWLMPAVQSGVPVNDLMANNRLQAFAPTADDAAKAVASPQQQPLDQVFAANLPAQDFDEKVQRLNNLRMENAEPIAPASGNFFQRKLEESQPPSEEENG